MNHLCRFVLLLLLLPLAAGAEPAPLKTVPLGDFMQNQLRVPIGLPLPVPAEYEPAKLAAARVSYSYWMRPEDAEKANASGSLPADNGFMYGKISLDVGYDRAKDLFIGAEEPESIAKARKVFSAIELERYRFGEHAVLLMTLAAPESNKLVYAMYVATNIETNVVYVALRPANDSREVGDQVWASLKASLVKSAPSRPEAPAPAAAAPSFLQGLQATTAGEKQEATIVRFAEAAAKGEVEEMMSMLWPGTRSSFGEEGWRTYLKDKIVPYFAGYRKIDGYKGLSPMTMQDPQATPAIVHFVYLRDDADARKPIEMVLVSDATGTYVANLRVGTCVKGHHPVCD